MLFSTIQGLNHMLFQNTYALWHFRTEMKKKSRYHFKKKLHEDKNVKNLNPQQCSTRENDITV